MHNKSEGFIMFIEQKSHNKTNLPIVYVSLHVITPKCVRYIDKKLKIRVLQVTNIVNRDFCDRRLLFAIKVNGSNLEVWTWRRQSYTWSGEYCTPKRKCANFSTYMRRPLVVYSYMTLHPIPINFLIYEENFILFYQCMFF